MYHIADDKRAKTSASLIADGLLNCLRKKGFSSISISDINRASLVSRSTFYRLFDNITDVISYLCDSMFEEIIQEFSTRNWGEKDNPTILFLDNIMKHSLLIDILVKENQSGILYNTHLKYISYFYKYFFRSTSLTTEEETYAAGVLSSLLCSVITTWCKAGKKGSAEQLYQRIQNCIRVLEGLYTD